MAGQIARRIAAELRAIQVLLVAITSLAVTAPVSADGVLYNKQGRLVQEEQQHAFIERENGQERMFAVTHCAVVAGICLTLDVWLSRY